MRYEKTADSSTIRRMDDGVYIPIDPTNADYVAFISSGETLHDPEPGPNAGIDAQILALEATVTQRRLREAALTEEGKKWLEAVDAQIAALRAQRV